MALEEGIPFVVATIPGSWSVSLVAISVQFIFGGQLALHRLISTLAGYIAYVLWGTGSNDSFHYLIYIFGWYLILGLF